MKELSIEEKAKRYDELKVTAQELEHDGCFDKITLFDLFPELKESEGEKIRKELIKETKGSEVRLFETVTNDEFIAWLEMKAEKESVTCPICGWEIEKQGEQKSADIRTTGYWNVQEVEQKPAWSEEDENRINRLIAYFEDKESFTAEDDIVYANWLKSLKDRVLPQPKQEWSVDDERTYRSVLYDFEHHLPLNCVQQEFVKSYIQPQNRWKPSDEQIEALQTVYDWYKNNLPQLTGMQSLFNDLLKLK